MADIDVVPKRSSNLWLWIIIAVMLLAIVWGLAASRGTTTRVGQRHDLRLQSADVVGMT